VQLIRAVVFDIGGVLEHTPPTGWEARWERRLGLGAGTLGPRIAEAAKGGAIGTITEAEAEQRIGEALGLERSYSSELEGLLADLWAEYLGEPNGELISWFSRLRPRYRTGILSNSFVGAREREHARYGFADLCDHLLYSHEEGMEKPDRRFFELAWTRLGVAPEEMLFLDDVEGHVAAARQLGIRAVLFVDNAQAIPELEAALGTEP
jgi:putative hydrolase of the HAD superfamily